VIAHVLTSFGVGGGERVALSLAAAQRATGHRVIAVSLAAGGGVTGAPGAEPMAAEFAAHGVAAHTAAKRRGFDATLPARLAGLFRDHGVTVVHTHNALPLIYATPAGKSVRAIVVHTRHGVTAASDRQLCVRRAVSCLTDAYVAVSPDVAALARRAVDCPPSRLRVIENGVDPSRFRPDPDARRAVRDELGIPPAAWVVGTVGRLVAEKNQDLLVRAAAPLLGAPARLLIAGDGPRRREIEALAAGLPGGRHVQLLGGRRDVPRVLAALDVFALSSRTEGLPLAVLEAMAVGLPVVSTAVGGVPHVVEDGKSGLLAPAGDETALRERLTRLRDDRAFAADAGARGRAIAVARYSVAAMCGRYLDLYDDLHRRRRAAA